MGHTFESSRKLATSMNSTPKSSRCCPLGATLRLSTAVSYRRCLWKPRHLFQPPAFKHTAALALLIILSISSLQSRRLENNYKVAWLVLRSCFGHTPVAKLTLENSYQGICDAVLP